MLKVCACPSSLLESLRDVPFVCPLCRGELDVRDQAYHCDPCARTYPLHAGIPDFRVFPDPYLDPEAEYRRTEIILSALDRLPLEPLLEFYWSHSDITPPLLRARFIRNALLGERRGERMLRILQGESFQKPVACSRVRQNAGRPHSGECGYRRVLEIGSGTGNFLIVAAPQFEQVVGLDIAMRWLHLSRRRFMDRGLRVPPLVCCCAEHLPFPDGAFDATVSWSTLEFTREPARFFAECARALTPGGPLYLNTANRYTLARDPYSHLWGVGFLPRAWQARYVRWRRKASYEQVRTVSLPELRRLARPHFDRIEVALPDIDDESLSRLSWFVRAQVRVYRGLKRLPLIRSLLRWIAPQWDIRLSKRPSAGGPR